MGAVGRGCGRERTHGATMVRPPEAANRYWASAPRHRANAMAAPLNVPLLLPQLLLPERVPEPLPEPLPEKGLEGRGVLQSLLRTDELLDGLPVLATRGQPRPVA